MKAKHFAYAFLALAVGFFAWMSYLFFASGDRASQASDERQNAAAAAVLVADSARTVSGRPGRLLIAYSGDLLGSLDPCG